MQTIKQRCRELLRVKEGKTNGEIQLRDTQLERPYKRRSQRPCAPIMGTHGNA